ncbi:hypothetical protein DFH08DRAFT_817107 [Mycena albidolilacea]|uniref:CCHC-type domain-containing protein n=1 Tax=Mycena albidolilacea TaxID=1033008 RepID=A0AAD7EHA5_9AGAR|nr:hypothetical protein DFH08DRAFT_817107 [Mycena albidolilacea]
MASVLQRLLSRVTRPLTEGLQRYISLLLWLLPTVKPSKLRCASPDPCHITLCHDPVRRNLFPAVATAHNTLPDSEHLQMILNTPVTIHPRMTTGLAAYVQQVAAYVQKHGSCKPNHNHPYPLTPGTMPVASGECHKCGLNGHFGPGCSAAVYLCVPAIEEEWRRIVQSICTRAAHTQATAVNIVADADDGADVFGGSTEYNAQTITRGSRAPPTRQAPSPAPCTPVEQIDQPDITGQQLREHWRHKNSDRDWWRTPPSAADITQEDATGGRDTPPARQVDSAPSTIPVHPDDTSDAANAVPRVKSSAQRRRAIKERREREQKATEAREREQAVAVRKMAAEARAVLKALVGKQGVAREPFTNEERSAWWRMKALGNGGRNHRHMRNSEGNSRFPSREVPPHLDLVPVRVSDTTGCRKPRRPHKPEEQGGKWLIWLKIRPRVENSEPTAPHVQNLGGSSRSPPREVKSAWRKKTKPFIDTHIDSCLPQLCDGVSNLGEPAPDWRGIWHINMEENGDNLGVEQPEAAARTDKSLFTRKTNPRDPWRMAEVKWRITPGKGNVVADGLSRKFVGVPLTRGDGHEWTVCEDWEARTRVTHAFFHIAEESQYSDLLTRFKDENIFRQVIEALLELDHGTSPRERRRARHRALDFYIEDDRLWKLGLKTIRGRDRVECVTKAEATELAHTAHTHTAQPLSPRPHQDPAA